MHCLFLYCILVLNTFFLSGCAPALLFGGGLTLSTSTAEERGLGGVISDSALKNTINYRLMKHSFSLFSKVSVTVYQGRALVTGALENTASKEEVLQIIKGVGGVKEVIDEITITDLDLKQMAIDSWITTQLDSSLALDPEIESINYKINTINGTVYITGIAQDQSELEKVTNYARNLANVKKVVSHVRLKHASNASDTITSETKVSEINDSGETSSYSFTEDKVTVIDQNNSTEESPLAGLE